MPDDKKPEDDKKTQPPILTGSNEDDEDMDFAWQLMDEHDRREAEKPKPIDRLKQALANLSSVFGNSPPPEGDNEITEEERAAMRELLGATPAPSTNAEARVGMYTAPSKPLEEERN